MEGRLRLAEKERARLKGKAGSSPGGASMLLLPLASMPADVPLCAVNGTAAGSQAVDNGVTGSAGVRGGIEELQRTADENMAALLQEEEHTRVRVCVCVEGWGGRYLRMGQQAWVCTCAHPHPHPRPH